MDSSSVIVDSIFNDFVRCKKQVDSLWDDIDNFCLESLRKTISVCFVFPDSIDGSNLTTEKEGAGIAHLEKDVDCLPSSKKQEKDVLPSAKKRKLSLHSRKCEHSPHNRKVELLSSNHAKPKLVRSPRSSYSQTAFTIGSHGDVSLQVAGPPDNYAQFQQGTDMSLVLHPSVPATQTTRSSTHLDNANKHVQPLLDTPNVGVVEQALVPPKSPEQANSKLPESSTVCETQKPEKIQMAEGGNNQVPVSASPSFDSTSVSNTSSNKGPSPAVHCGETSARPNQSSVATTLPAHQLSDFRSQSNLLSAKKASLDSYHQASLKKIRPFASAERLGGASRLLGLSSTTVSSTRANSRLQLISETGQRTSQLNDSHGGLGSSRTNERSRSVLAAKEVQDAEKRRLFESRLEEKAARVRAFQDAKQREREAQKRANEQRRLAVKSKAQQMADMHRMLLESKKQLADARAKAESEKTKLNPTMKRLPVQRIPEKENVPPSQTRLATVAKVVQSHATQPQPTGIVSFAAPSVTVHHPPPVVKLPAHAVSAIKPSVIQSTHSGTSPAAADKTFDMSQLNSDSESDEEKPAIKAPQWSRKGTLELLPAFKSMKDGTHTWPSMFLQAADIPFDVDEIFVGYQYRRRPRTSSGVWNTPNRPYV
ncbi:hypothetical protein P879_01593 [Paragonimus westermani]|uniref:Uncharacterized protein n=1 Tax=Paragonimus westermani TaxID=34504 RepID=A0A8T0D7K2_9TREM|nr:hypothetical protein P879_01593 [Paragonimus westermani]